VVEPPSRRLQQILLGLKLCSPRDLRRCAPRVKALSADLPAFDSVWLDALVQRRVLTSWQAQTIELDQPELLRIGPCVIERHISQSHGSATYLARLPEQQGQCVIKRVVVPTELRKSVTERLQKLVERGQRLQHAGVQVPYSFSEVSEAPLPELDSNAKLKESASTRASRQVSTASPVIKQGSKAGVGRARRRTKSANNSNDGQLQMQLAIVSRLVDGLSLSDILLRRGRLPATDVDAIARQLLESLAALHENGVVHGEILLRNIRLTLSGQAVLVDAGVRPALQPEFQISAHVAPEQNDGIAPELIGTAAAATPRSDLYALGFSLWHLLAGRPAFPTGDPLAKLAAHQTERIPDIREFAPDTPVQLARMIEWLTEPMASRRPKSARELLSDGGRDRPVSARRGHLETQNGSTPTGPTGDISSRQSVTEPTNRRLGIRPAGRASRRRLSKFAAGFQQPLRRTAPPSSRRRTVKPLAFATAAIIIAIAALLTFDVRSRNLVLTSLPQRFAEHSGFRVRPVDENSADPSENTTPDDSGNPIDTESVMKPVGGEVPQIASPAGSSRKHSSPDSQQNTNLTPTVSSRSVSQLLPLPEPDPYGVVLFSDPGFYDAGAIVWPGSHLTLRGLPGVPVRIVVSTQALQLRATEVTLENVEVSLATTASKATTLSRIRSQKLTCLNCDFVTPTGSQAASGTAISDAPQTLATGMAIQWGAIDNTDPLAGELTFNNCRFAGSHSTVMLGSPGRLVRCSNTLKLGSGPLFLATGLAASGDNIFELEQTTLRNSGSLVGLDLRNSPPWKSRLTIRPRSSVFDLRHRSEHESESLITFVGGRLQLNWYERVLFDGDDSVASPSVGLASWQAANGSGHQTLDAGDVSVRGLTQTEFSFHSASSQNRVDSVLADMQTNRISAQLPGISADARATTPERHNEMLLIGPEISPEP